jgi:hypothetical protein
MASRVQSGGMAYATESAHTDDKRARRSGNAKVFFSLAGWYSRVNGIFIP